MSISLFHYCSLGVAKVPAWYGPGPHPGIVGWVLPGPGMKLGRSWASLDKPRTRILLKKIIIKYIILNIYIYLTHLLYIYKVLNT